MTQQHNIAMRSIILLMIDDTNHTYCSILPRKILFKVFSDGNNMKTIAQNVAMYRNARKEF